jgi:hypothetical protein
MERLLRAERGGAIDCYSFRGGYVHGVGPVGDVVKKRRDVFYLMRLGGSTSVRYRRKYVVRTNPDPQ